MISVIHNIRDNIMHSNFGLEVSYDIPKNHPQYEFFTNEGKHFKQGEGFYIKNLKVGDTEVIVEGGTP